MTNARAWLGGRAVFALVLLMSATQAKADPQVIERARTLIAGGNAKQAYAELAPLQDKLTGMPEFDYLLGVAALDSGRNDEAIIAFERVLALIPNHAGAPVTISALRATLPDYQISAAQCIGTLAPRAFCDVNVVFRPIAPGPRQASLVVDASPAQSDAVSLVGVGCRLISFGRGNPARLCSP